MSANKREAIVVGGGLAGLSCTMKLADLGFNVKLVSLTNVKRSHSVCAQGGINVAINLMGEGDSPDKHAYDTIKGGDFLADQPPVLEMCYNGPALIRMLDKMGVPFNRKIDGSIDFRRFGGTLYKRTAFVGASTGQQLLYSLDEQVRSFELKGQVIKFEHHEFLRAVLDNQGVCRGIVVVDLFNMATLALAADVVIMATGGNGNIFKYSTNSTICTGSSVGRLYRQGLWLANPEFVQIHPTAIPGKDKLRLISESVRGEGGRIWVYGDSSKKIEGPSGTVTCGKNGERWYFLEELFPAFGNLVPRDVASRYILKVVNLGMGVEGKNQVYLDVVDLEERVKEKIGSVLDIYKKFTGVDPWTNPMKIFPAVHYSMGGLWVDWPAYGEGKDRFRQMTNVRGLFAVGECEFLYHGANRLGANSLLSCIYGGMLTANEVLFYHPTEGGKEQDFKEAESIEKDFQKELFSRNGKENVYGLYDELAEHMIKNCTVVRTNKGLQDVMNKTEEIKERMKNISLDDKGILVNQSLHFANQLEYMLDLCFVIAKGALKRDEFRGSHYKEGWNKRDDENFLKTTLVKFDGGNHSVDYLSVDTRHFDPELRDYTKVKKTVPKVKNMPSSIPSVTGLYER